MESESALDHNTARLEASSDTGYPPTPQAAPSPSCPYTSPPFTGFTSPPSCSHFCPRLYPHPEESDEDKEALDPGGDDPGGAQGSLTESHPVDPVHSGIAEQVAYYEALLQTVDKYMQEADRALQALQDSPPHAQLRGRERIQQRSRILRDELVCAESNLRPEALEIVHHQQCEQLRPPT